MSKIYPPKSPKVEFEYRKIASVFFNDWVPGIEVGFWEHIRKTRMDVGVLCMEKSKGDNRKENVKLYPWLFSAVSRNIALNEGWLKKGYIPTSFWWPLFNDKKISDWFKNLNGSDKEIIFKAIALEGLFFNRKIKYQFLEEKIFDLTNFFGLLKEQKNSANSFVSEEEKRRSEKILDVVFNQKTFHDKELFQINVDMANEWKKNLNIFFKDKKINNSIKKMPVLFENFIFSNVQWALGEDDLMPKSWFKKNFNTDLDFESSDDWMKNEGFMIAKVPEFSSLFKDVDVLYGDAFEFHISNNSFNFRTYYLSPLSDKERTKIDLFNKIEKLKTNLSFPSPIESWWKRQLENVFLLNIECDKKSELSKFVIENKKPMNEDLVFYYFALYLFKYSKDTEFKNVVDLFVTFDWNNNWEKKLKYIFSEDTFFDSIEKFNKLMLKTEIKKESLKHKEESEEKNKEQEIKIKKTPQRF